MSAESLDRLLERLRRSNDAYVEIGVLDRTGRLLAYAGTIPDLAEVPGMPAEEDPVDGVASIGSRFSRSSTKMATGGSTNAVLHFLAIAHCAEVPWTIDDFETIRRKVPVICDLKPSGEYLAVDLHRAGGIPKVMRLLLDAGLLHGDCMTVTGKTIQRLDLCQRRLDAL